MEKIMMDKKLGIILLSIIFSIMIITINLNNYVHAECKNCVMINDKKKIFTKY